MPNATKYRFHKAAKDGNVDILSEATSRDSNRPDEDGMTPTLWAANRGNISALRMLMTRGADPDKCDILGNAALHHASITGHLGCVSFLVQFGVNLWNLDNEFHTAMDLAALNDNMEVVRYLDEVVADQAARNHKSVRKLKEKAGQEAQKRAKEFSKLQVKAQKKANKEERKMTESDTKILADTQGATEVDRTDHRRTVLTLGGFRKKDHNHNSAPSFSELNRVPGGSLKGAPVEKRVQKKSVKSTSNNDFKVAEISSDGTKSMRSLVGRKSGQVLYARNQRPISTGSESLDNLFDQPNGPAATASDPDLTYKDSGLDTSSDERDAASMFVRPGFGSVSFLNSNVATTAMMSLPRDSADLDPDEGRSSSTDEEPRPRRKTKSADDNYSIGSAGTLATRIRKESTPDDVWDDDVLEEDEESTPLELFLAACSTLDVLPLFNEEQIDMDALLLCSDSDLKEAGVPLGPRRKIIDAIERRKEVTEVSGPMTDTRL